ncbi:AAA family ATPase [Deminuibacter soli]|uniref:ATPase n=1 Tax=Deminuibacter soli TaxID=2291815 RepID=A0A3E1NR07_9BACT|nr:ATP-binding protein [Deminuibacter soli]RFM30365.1 ATPase [Deminuibacter soli]
MNNQLKKIVVIGPESTGKSTLCEQLAQHFQTLWAPEYARDYLHLHGTDYRYADLLPIAKGQLSLEDRYALMAAEQWEHKKEKPTVNPVLFIDTDMYVMKVWGEFVFGRCHQFVLDHIVQRSYDLYLFCNIDLPWIKDELREYPDEQPRKELFHIYRDLLINQHVPWVNITGNYEERLQKGIAAVKEFCLH